MIYFKCNGTLSEFPNNNNFCLEYSDTKILREEIKDYLLIIYELTEHTDIHAKNDLEFRWACYNKNF